MRAIGSKAAFLLFALSAFSANLTPAARAVDCERPASIQEREDCTSGKTIAKEKFDSQTGLDVVESLNDLDWKSTDRDKLPWSQIIKLKSALDGSYELIVFDRDYASNFNSGAKEGVITRWSIDTLKGITYTAGGCGFWTCTRERTQVNNLPDSIELFVGSESFKVYGTDGEFAIPQGFINSLKSSGTTKVNLKIKTTSFYCCSFGDELMTGLQGPFEGRYGISVRDFGEVQDAPVFRTRVDWYVGFAVCDDKAAARLYNIGPAVA